MPSSRCLVRISDAADGEPSDRPDTVFNIAGITVTSPGGGETWYCGGADQDITRTGLGGSGNGDIDLHVYAAEGTPVVIGAYSTTNNESIGCVLPLSGTFDSEWAEYDNIRTFWPEFASSMPIVPLSADLRRSGA